MREGVRYGRGMRQCIIYDEDDDVKRDDGRGNEGGEG
jgi:hypothetical protein